MSSPSAPRPRLLIVGGTNGAGKTTILDLMSELVTGERIDPDAIARGLSTSERAGLVLEAGRIAIGRTNAALAARRDFTVETTLAGRQPLELMRRARSQGYEVALVFVGTADPRLNIERIRRRVQDSGHAISDEDVRRRFSRSLANLVLATSLADAVAVFDNSGEPGELRVVYDRDETGEFIAEDAPGWFLELGALPHRRGGGG